jgi:hypothetical protein
MSGALDRRLIALERAPAARGLLLRVYAIHTDAEADREPPEPWRALLKIITGLPRAPDAGAP